MAWACVPSKRYLDVLLVDGEAQVQELELAVVAVEHIAARGAALAGAAHVLPQAVESRTLLGVALGVIAIRVADVGLEGVDPVDFVGGLEWHRDHWRLRHRVSYDSSVRAGRQDARGGGRDERRVDDASQSCEAKVDRGGGGCSGASRHSSGPVQRQQKSPPWAGPLAGLVDGRGATREPTTMAGCHSGRSPLMRPRWGRGL